MFQRLDLFHSSRFRTIFLGALVLMAWSHGALFAQGNAGFWVEVDPPFALQGDEPITFTATVENPAQIESFMWSNGITGDTLGTGSSITLDPNFAEPTPVFVVATDVNGLEGRGFAFIETGNAPPIGFGVKVDPPYVVQGETPLTFTATTDHSEPIVRYEWRNDLTQEVLGTSASITLDPNFQESTPISVVLEDDQGAMGFGGSFIQVGDGGPNHGFVMVDPPFVIQGNEPIVFTATASDGFTPDSWEWTRLDTGDILGTESTLTLQPIFEYPVDIQVKAVDADGNEALGFTFILVEGNPFPDLLIVEIDPPLVFQTDEPIVFTANVNDPKAIIESYRWVNDTTGLVLGTEQTLTLDPIFTEPTVISCTVTDSTGKTGMGCSLILPDGSNLPGFGVFIDPPIAFQGEEPMVFTAEPVQGLTAQSFAWRNLNTGDSLGNTQSITLDPTFTEVTTLEVTMVDTENRSYVADALILVDPIGPPILGVFVDPPFQIQDDSPMTFTAMVNNGGAASGSGNGGEFTYEWVREDTGEVLGSEASVTLPPSFERTTSLRVTVTDSQNRSGEGFGLVIVDGVVLPELWVMVDPPFVNQADTPITFTAIIAAGHTAASYSWVNENSGEVLGDAKSITLDPVFTEITSIRLDVQDTDGNQASSFALIFVNEIPNLFEVSVTPPLAVQTDQPLTFTAVIPENIQASEFTWTNLSTGDELGSTQTITVPPDFERSTTIGVNVVASDGSQGFGFSILIVSDVAASFTVQVTPPIANQGVQGLEFQAKAPEGVVVSEYQWFNDETGALLGTGETLNLTDPFLVPTLIRVEANASDGGLGVGYALVLVFPAGPDPNGDGMNTLADLHHELPNWNFLHTVKELMMINIGH